MKLLVISDTHGETERMRYAIAQTRPDAVAHLGDHIRDAMSISAEMPDTPCYMVVGNTDPTSSGQSEMLITLQGKRILLTHGHIYHVKFGLHRLSYRAAEQQADLVLFGHTHKAIVKPSGSALLCNPGQMQRHDTRCRSSYALVDLTDGDIRCELVYLPD